MSSFPQFKENADPLLWAHLSTGEGIGGIGFLKGAKNPDYSLHTLILRRFPFPANTENLSQHPYYTHSCPKQVLAV